MIHVRIEVVKWGQENMRETVREIFIGNDGTGDENTGNYDVYTSDPRGKPYPRNSRDGWVGRIEGVPRTPAHRELIVGMACDLVTNSATRANNPESLSNDERGNAPYSETEGE